MKIGIVTDSTSDIPADLAVRNGIEVVPAIMVIDGRSLEDGRGISREELYRQLPSMQSSPTTAAPSIGSFEKAYSLLFNSGAEQIVSIHVASSLSGIYGAAVAAARSFGDCIQVLDSRHLTLGLGFQVLAAAEAVRSGKSLNEIRKVIDEIREHTHLVAMLDTLEYVRRSGRVSWAKSSLSSLFQIKPFLGVKDGKVLRLGETRTRHKGIERLYQMLSDLGPLRYLAVLHTNAEQDAIQFMERTRQNVKNQPLIINVTSVIGVHVGPNGLGFVAVT
jgi:DegV family protein with EDD domain